MEKAKFRIPMFAKVKAQNSSVRVIKSTELQCLEKLKYRTPMFGTAKTVNSNVENAKIQN